MRVLLADRLDPIAHEGLVALGCDVHEDPTLTGDTLAEALRTVDPDVLVVRSTRVTADHIAAGRSLGLVVRAGAGVNTIDLGACADRAVFVANCPGKNAIAVAELTFGLLLAIDRRLPAATADVAQGRWRKKHWAAGASGLAGRTLGVLGVGRIGQAVIARAKAFGMPVVAWSRSLAPARAMELGVTHAASPVEVASACDVLTVHLAATPQTHGLVGAEILAALRPGSIVLNTSRPEVVDEDALLDAVRHRGIRAGLDVLSAEPSGDGDVRHPLLQEDGVLVTPHLGASTAQASEAVADEVVRIVRAWRERGRVPNVVNRARRVGGTVLVVRHLDRVGVLASVLDRLRADGVNVEDMENVILDGGRSAVARIACGGTVDDALVADIEALDHVLRATRTTA